MAVSMRLKGPVFANGAWGAKQDFSNWGEYLGPCGEAAAAVLQLMTASQEHVLVLETWRSECRACLQSLLAAAA